MTLEEKKTLAELLGKYMLELSKLDTETKKKKKEAKAKGNYYFPPVGVRSRYERARLLKAETERDIQKEIEVW